MKNDRLCCNCDNISTEITRYGLKPRCNKNIYKYKERSMVDWENDKDLQRTCPKHVLFKPDNQPNLPANSMIVPEEEKEDGED